MEPQKTYTCRQSELAPLTAENKAEIAEIDLNVTDLILKFQGNYNALYALTETLVDCHYSAEASLQCIRIVPDGDGEEAVSRAIGLTDLPILEKELLISTAITSTVAIKVLAGIFGCDFEQAASHVRRVGQADFEEISPERIESAVAELAKTLHENPGEGVHKIEL